MRALIQRVTRASVRVREETVASIGSGLLVFVGVGRDDEPDDADRLAARVAGLRIFPGAEGGPEEPVGEREVLCVSQFTLYADTSRGRRPSYSPAAPGHLAEPLYERFRSRLGARGGAFGEHMEIELVNDGPLTLLLESPAP